MEITDWNELCGIPGIEDYVPEEYFEDEDELIMYEMSQMLESSIAETPGVDATQAKDMHNLLQFLQESELKLQTGVAFVPKDTAKKEKVQKPKRIAADISETQYNVGHGNVRISEDLYDTNTTWESLNLPVTLQKRLYELDFKRPFPIQAHAVRAAQKGSTILLRAPTSAGKTIAFSLALLQSIDETIRAPQAICIVNTLELALQVFETVRALKPRNVDVYLATSDRVNSGVSHLDSQIVVGTFGTIYHRLHMYGAFDHPNTKCFVVDEADITINDENAGQMADMFYRFKQRIFSSATLDITKEAFENWKQYVTPLHVLSMNEKTKQIEVEEKKIKDVALINLSDEHKVFALQPEFLAVINVVNQGEQVKYDLIPELFKNLPDSKKTLVFVNRKRTAEVLHDVACRGLPADYTHGGRYDRSQVMMNFRGLGSRNTDILVTTDLSSRGIDVLTAAMIVNYDIPRFPSGEFDYKTFCHRLGRIGRLGQPGLAVTICSTQSDLDAIAKVEEEIGAKMHRIDTENIEEELEDLFDRAIGVVEKQKENVSNVIPDQFVDHDGLGDADEW